MDAEIFGLLNLVAYRGEEELDVQMILMIFWDKSNLELINL